MTSGIYDPKKMQKVKAYQGIQGDPSLHQCIGETVRDGKAYPSRDPTRQEDAEREHMADDEAYPSLDQGVQDDADMASLFPIQRLC